VRPTVLIVDDHAGFRRSARRMLEAEGFDVVGESPDGASAVAMVRTLRPQVVLLDVLLPDTDGFAVAGRIAMEDRRPRIVLTSSRDRSEFGARIGRAAADGFLAKSELSGDALRSLTGVGP
jgi:two-component system response regulator FimZ (fimbrial Z protein)